MTLRLLLSLWSSGPVPAGHMSAVCQPEAVLPQPVAHFPHQLPLQPQGNETSQRLNRVFMAM